MNGKAVQETTVDLARWPPSSRDPGQGLPFVRQTELGTTIGPDNATYERAPLRYITAGADTDLIEHRGREGRSRLVTRHRPESSAVNSTASNQNLRSFVLELAHYAEYARAYRCAGRASRLAPISQLWAPTLTGAAWGSLVRGCCSSLQFHAPEQRLRLVSLSQRPGKGNSPLGAWRLGCAGPQPGGSRTATKEGCARSVRPTGGRRN